MGTEVITLRPPATVHEPRGAAIAVMAATGLRKLAQALARAGRALWRALEEQGRRRAWRELHGRGLPAAALEAAKVRALADEHEHSDPRFAAELRAAAAWHEAKHGIE